MKLYQFLTIAFGICAVVSCQKTLTTAPAPDADPTKQTTSLIPIGPLPAIVWWGTLSDLPFVDGIMYPQGFAINGKGYVCGGRTFDSRGNSLPFYQLWELDTATRVWTRKADVPVDVAQGASFVLGNDAYVVSRNAVYRYDQPGNSWTRLADFPGAARFQGNSCAINGKGYLGLGIDAYTAVLYNDWWEYDPAADHWTRKTNFAGGTRMSSFSFAVDTKGYVCAGEKVSGSTVSYPGDCWQYDPVANTWLQRANMPTSHLLGGAGLNGTVNSGGHYGFVMVGGTGGCLEYNPSTNTWGTLPDMPGGDRHQFGAFMIGRSIFIAGGTGGTHFARADVHALNWSK